MAINRIDKDEDEASRQEREEAAEKARIEKEEAAAAKTRELELKAARAESALEEARRFRSEPVVVGPTEAQWLELEAQNPGSTRQEIQAEANKIAAIADARMKPINDRASAAEERAAKAEERAARLEARRGLDKVEDSFYKKNPTLEPHKAEVEAFLSEFPETTDPKTLEKRLGLASDYVRGKVKTLRSEPRRGEFSSRSVESEDGEDRGSEFSGQFDPKGTGGNRGAIALMETVIDEYGRDVNHEDSVDMVKKWSDDEGRGVEIDSKEEVAHARSLIRKGVILGGKRGEK